MSHLNRKFSYGFKLKALNLLLPLSMMAGCSTAEPNPQQDNRIVLGLLMTTAVAGVGYAVVRKSRRDQQREKEELAQRQKQTLHNMVKNASAIKITKHSTGKANAHSSSSSSTTRRKREDGSSNSGFFFGLFNTSENHHDTPSSPNSAIFGGGRSNGGGVGGSWDNNDHDTSFGDSDGGDGGCDFKDRAMTKHLNALRF